MVINGADLVDLRPVNGMLSTKESLHGVSHGLAEVGYDIRLKQSIWFYPQALNGRGCTEVYQDEANYGSHMGRFVIASAIEEFSMPNNLVGIIHDKSTWARQGLSVFNTVIEAGWEGFLTLELVYHGQRDLHIPAGSGIAQVVFHQLSQEATYQGKYQHQADEPVPSIFK